MNDCIATHFGLWKPLLLQSTVVFISITEVCSLLEYIIILLWLIDLTLTLVSILIQKSVLIWCCSFFSEHFSPSYNCVKTWCNTAQSFRDAQM